MLQQAFHLPTGRHVMSQQQDFHPTTGRHVITTGFPPANRTSRHVTTTSFPPANRTSRHVTTTRFPPANRTRDAGRVDQKIHFNFLLKKKWMKKFFCNVLNFRQCTLVCCLPVQEMLATPSTFSPFRGEETAGYSRASHSLQMSLGCQTCLLSRS